ncbi:FliH/SctL family protein [Herbaspirillum sp. YR522]|uniref:FliH/SctL family protein n=1 Tax=Herbaspirillum sp. YR522 TaxID=1144342 RepID=UPI00026FC502|nr:FliH/SctL family protein [Herbaspirillum sp. YR522]EJN02573.1 flagellar biosynthesis/type III secretory pathway protein [Herbaspirillum sp. YR522]
MTIISIDGWVRPCELLIDPAQARTIGELEDLAGQLRQEHAARRLALAKRLRQTRKTAARLGRRDAQARVAADMVEVFAAYGMAWKNFEGIIVSTVVRALQQILDTIPPQELLQAQIGRCIAAAREDDVLAVHVHPDQLSEADAILRALGVMVPEGACTVLPNPSLMLGGCVLETRMGAIDGSLHTQIDMVRDAIALACQTRRPLSWKGPA